MILLALLAIIVPLVLLTVFKMSAQAGMTISAVVVILAALVGWGMEPLAVSASALQAIHISLTIGLILFGAIALLNVLENTGALARIKQGLNHTSTDMRVQAVIVAFAFVSIIEGISGFGTPSIVAAPILLALGFRPLAAAALVLLGDTVTNTFGALATPLFIGLENVPIYSNNLISLVAAQVTLFDMVIGTLLPLGLVTLLIFAFGHQSKRQKWRSLREIAPWSLFIGLVYSASALIVVRFIGPEFTAVIAGSIALAVATISAHFGWLVPANTWRHHASTKAQPVEVVTGKQMPLWQAWLPYVIVIGLMVLTRILAPLRDLLISTANASWPSILGYAQINSTWEILYSPGTILFIGALIASLILSRSLKPLGLASVGASKTTIAALLALVPTLIMVQVFSNSGLNTYDLVSMPVYIGQTLAGLFGEFWLAVAPLLGSIGAFISGSSTVSTLTMSPIQYSTAIDVGLSPITVLSMQMLGADAGNTIAIHNVVAVAVVVGLAKKEGLIIHRLIKPTLAYIALASLLGLIVLLVS